MLLCHHYAEKMQSIWSHARTVSRGFFFPLLTDPMPESATESLPESVVCVLLFASESVFSALPPTGQLILAVIWLVLVPIWANAASFWLVSLNGGVTVMLGTGLSSCPLMLGEEGLDLTCPVPEEGLCGEPEEETWSGPENLLIRFLTLPDLCRFDLPAAGFFWLDLQACSASSSLVVWWGLSGDWEGKDSGGC